MASGIAADFPLPDRFSHHYLKSPVGYACFGKKSWVDNFFREMRVVKAALKQSSIEVKYSRSIDRPGYYLWGRGHSIWM